MSDKGTISTRSLWTPEQAQAVKLVVGMGLTQDEAAERLGVGQATVARTLQRAYEVAREAAEDGYEVIPEIFENGE